MIHCLFLNDPQYPRRGTNATDDKKWTVISFNFSSYLVPDKTDLCLNINCDFYGQCTVVNGKAKCVCKRACPMTFDQICGSDGTTYANECVMKTQACLMQKMITVFTKGKCIGK